MDHHDIRLLFQKRDNIFTEGDRRTKIYSVLNGRVATRKGNEKARAGSFACACGGGCNKKEKEG